MINPYEFLGVTPQSSLAEIKRNYFRLSLLCHPDKGGHTADMVALQSAYSYVVKEITYAQQQSSNVCVDEVETMYEAFKASFPVSTVPNFLEIVADKLEFDKDTFDRIAEENGVPEQERPLYYRSVLIDMACTVVNEDLPDTLSSSEQMWEYVRTRCAKLYAETQIAKEAGFMYASIPHGYGADARSVDATSFGPKDLTVYTEPVTQYKETLSSIIPFPTKDGSNMYASLSDYSVYDHQLYDYALAHQVVEVTSLSDSDLVAKADELIAKADDLTRRWNVLLEDRQRLDAEIEKGLVHLVLS